MRAREILGAAALLSLLPLVHGCRPDRWVDSHVSCDSGTCICVGGYDDCDGDEDTGCEANLSTDPDNCGACGNTCSNGTCTAGTCACEPGFVDCNGYAGDGCESDPMNDPQNCGACGHGCWGGSCAQGVCLPATVEGLEGAVSLAVDGGYVYVARCGAPSVARARTDTVGAAIEPVGQATTDCASLVAAASGQVFWVAGDLTIYAAQADAPTDAATTVASGEAPKGLFVANDVHLYYRNEDSPTQTSLRRILTAAGDGPQTIPWVQQVLALAVDAKTGGYWSDSTGIHFVPTDSVSANDLHKMQAIAIAVSGDTIFASPGDGIFALPIAGGTATKLASSTSVRAIAADASHVYWTDTSDGSVRRIGRDGTDESTLASDESFAEGAWLAMDEHAVYWIAGSQVRRVAK